MKPHVAYARFVRLDADGRLDFDSGAWDHSSNIRKAHCGRCGAEIPASRGRPYNEFMTDFYRVSTRYLCRLCAGERFPDEVASA